MFRSPSRWLSWRHPLLAAAVALLAGCGGADSRAEPALGPEAAVGRFYVQRDTAPQRWYPRNPDGTIAKFDDLPARLRSNVNTTEAPNNRKPGDSPALDDREIDDVIAFLRTLNDGWRPR